MGQWGRGTHSHTHSHTCTHTHTHSLTHQLEARQRQAILQQRILEAEESARLAKLEAKGMNTAARHTTVSFDDDVITRSSGGNFVSEGVYSSLSKSEFRSPSMLQLMTSTDGSCQGDSNAPPTHRGRSTITEKGRLVGRNNKLANGGTRRRDSERETEDVVAKGRISRIPVMQQSQGATKQSKTMVGSRTQQRAKINTGNKMSNVQTREDGVRLTKAAMATNRPVVDRSSSPPVPVVAKRLKGAVSRKDDSLNAHSNPPPPGDTFIRSSSPQCRSWLRS